MSVNSVSNTNVSSSTQALHRAPEASEGRKAGPDNDGDGDDRGGVKAVQPSPAPIVNMNGQTVGRVISVKA